MLSGKWQLQQDISSPTQEETDVLAQLSAALKHELEKARCKRAKLLCPIWANPGHWVLLSIDFSGDAPQAQYYESLTQVHQECMRYSQRLLSFVDSRLKLPQRKNTCFQVVGSGLCGFHVLHYAESIVAAAAGAQAAACGWPQANAQAWKRRLIVLTAQLQTEQDKLRAELKKAEEATQKAKERQEKLHKQRSAAKEQEEKAAEAASTLAQSIMQEGKAFTEDDLSDQATAAIARTQLYTGVCSRCRWAYGCLTCDREKALRYWRSKEEPIWWLKKRAEQAAKLEAWHN